MREERASVMLWQAALAALALLQGAAPAAPAEAPPFDLKDTLSGKSGWLLDDAELILAADVKALIHARPLADCGLSAVIDGWLVFNPSPEADFLRGLSGVIVSASGRKARMVLRGEFDVGRLTAALKKPGFAKHSRDGEIDLFELTTPQGQTFHAAFHGKTALIVTESREATLALARDGPPKSSRQRKEMLAALKVFTGEECVAAALVGDEMKSRTRPLPVSATTAEALTAMTLSVTAGDDFRLDTFLHLKNEAAARTLKEDLAGLMEQFDSAIEKSGGLPEPSKSLYRSVRIRGGRELVSVGLKVTGKTVGMLVKGMPGLTEVKPGAAAAALLQVLRTAAVAPTPFLKDVRSGTSGWLRDDAGLVFATDVRGLLWSRPLAESGLAGLVTARLLFDPSPPAAFARGLSGVIVSASGLGDDWRSRVVLLGEFDVEGMSAVLRRSDVVTAEKVGGVEVFKWKEPPLFGAFVGKTAFVVTRDEKETVALARHGPPKASKQRKEMTAALKRFTGKECAVLALHISDPIRKAAGGNESFAVFFNSLDSVTLALVEDKDLALTIVLQGKDEAGAKKVETQLIGLKALIDAAVSMMDSIPQPIKDMIEAIKIERTRDKVTVGMKITAGVVKAVMKWLIPSVNRR